MRSRSPWLWFVWLGEVALFLFGLAIVSYEFSFPYEMGNLYTGTVYVNLFSLFAVNYIFFDERRKTRGILASLCVIFVVNIVNGLRITLYLPRDMYTAWVLEMILAWGHVAMTAMIIAYYVWMLFLEKPVGVRKRL